MAQHEQWRTADVTITEAWTAACWVSLSKWRMQDGWQMRLLAEFAQRIEYSVSYDMNKVH